MGPRRRGRSVERGGNPGVDSRSSSESPPSANGRVRQDRGGPVVKIVQLPYVLTDEERMTLAHVFPSVRFTASSYSGRHTHPVSATIRRVAEDELLAKLSGNILDIGGSPIRHSRAGRHNVHSCCPLLDPADAVRISKIKAAEARGVRLNYCLNKQEECWCMEYDVAISVHSLYYLSRDEILTRLLTTRNKEMYAIVHLFRSAAGYLHNREASYKRDGAGNVTMQMVGNLHCYHHSDMEWIDDCYYSGPHGAMAWTVEREYGDTYVIKFVPAPHGLKVGAMRADLPFHEAKKSNDLVGRVSFRGGDMKYLADLVEPTYGSFSLESGSLWSFGKEFVLFKDRKQLILPKNVIAHVAFYAAGKQRNDATFQMCLNEAKREYRRIYATPGFFADSVMWVTALGFASNLETEREPLSYVSDRKVEMASLNTALSFGEVKWLWTTAKVRTVFSALSSGVLGAAIGFRNKGGKVGTAAGGVIGALVGWAITWLYRRLFLKRIVTKFPPVLPAMLHSWDTGDVDYFKLPDSCFAGKELAAMERGSRVTPPEVEKCRPSFGLELCGIGSAGFTPQIARSCTHNEEIAVRNRITVVLTEQEGQWDRALHRLESILPPPTTVEEVPFHSWLARFPQGRHDMLIKGRAEAMTVKGVEDAKTIDAFVKREAILKNNEGGATVAFNPRLIQGRRPAFQAASGPWTLAISKHFAKKWHPKNWVTYSSGMTAEMLGTWFDEARAYITEAHGSYVCVEDDFSQFDGSLGIEATRFEEAVYARYNPPEWAKVCFSLMNSTAGVTATGVTYTTVGRRKSGDGNTSVGNSIVNTMAHSSALLDVINLAGLPTRGSPRDTLALHVRMIVLGDDNLIVTHPALVRAMKGLNFEDRLRAFGLRPKLVYRQRDCDVEYCSGLFWPAATQTVWGPKPGRVIAKTFYTKEDVHGKGPAFARGVALGLWQDAHHIPVLHEVLSTTLRLTAGVGRASVIREAQRPQAMEAHEPGVATLQFACDRYDVTREQLLALCDCVLNVPQLPALVSHPVLAAMERVDIGFEDETSTEAGLEQSRANFHQEPGVVLANSQGSGRVFVRYHPYSDDHVAWEVSYAAGLDMLAYLFAICPVVEEGLKHLPVVGHAFTFAIIFLEARRAECQASYMQTTGVLHLACALLPYKAAVLAHSAWNLAVYLAR